MNEMFILYEGATLAGLGMGFVFIFLAALVGSVKLMTSLVGCFHSVPNSEVSLQGNPKVKQDDEHMAIIATAVHRYRNR